MLRSGLPSFKLEQITGMPRTELIRTDLSLELITCDMISVLAAALATVLIREIGQYSIWLPPHPFYQGPDPISGLAT